MRWWGKTAKISIDIRDQSIPKEWLLEREHLLPDEQHGVLNVPDESGKLTAEEIEMTNADVDSLLEAYRSRKWTVRQVITAFLKKAVIMNQLVSGKLDAELMRNKGSKANQNSRCKTNFVTEFLHETALEQADALDAHLASTGALSGPLHGIPTSLAEPIPIAGRIAHAGIVSRINNPPPADDAHLVCQLKHAGAVIHLRTNVAQALVGQLVCENNIMGRTHNPHDRRLSPGGPCGGEGVSVGSRCAVLGAGVDVRTPAAFGGCYGLRPTAGRVPAEWWAEEGMGCVLGPLASSVDGLQAWMKAVLGQETNTLGASSWRSDVSKRDFTVGVLWDDGIVRPHPPLLRALRSAVDKLRAAGIKAVEWVPYDHQRGYDMLGPLYFLDGGKRYLTEFDKSGEYPLASTTVALDAANRSRGIPGAGLESLEALSRERQTYRQEHDTLMTERGVDFILGPAYVGAGALHDGPKCSHYTSIWNVLDLPSVVLPSGLRCDKDVDVRDETYVPKSDIDKGEWKACKGFSYPLTLSRC